jgi:tetratricopeptide (TPR) repeat protein
MDFGKYYDAAQYFERYAVIVNAIHGENHEQSIYSKLLLAEVYTEIGEFLMAKSYLDSVGNLYRNNLFAKQARPYCSFCAKQSTFYKKTGELDIALENALNALACYEGYAAADELDILNSMTNIAAVAWEQGDMKTAEFYLREVHVKYKESLPESFFQYISSLLNMALVENAAGNYTKGIDYCTEFLNLMDTIEGKYTFRRAGVRQVLTVSYSGLGDYQKAIEQIKSAISICEQDEACRNATFYSRLFTVMGDNYYEMKAYERAHKTFEIVHEERLKHLGPNHLLTLMARLKLIEMLWLSARNEEAQADLNELMPAYLDIAPVNHLFGFYWLKGKIHFSLGQFGEAYVAHDIAHRYEKEEFNSSITFMTEKELKHFIEKKREFFNELVSKVVPFIDYYPKFAELVYDQLITLKAFELNAALIKNQKYSLDSSSWENVQLLNARKREFETMQLANEPDTANIEQLANDITILERKLIKTNWDIFYIDKEYTWQDMQRQLKPDEAVIEFIHCHPDEHPEFYAAIVIGADFEQPSLMPFADKSLLRSLMVADNKTDLNNVYSTKVAVFDSLFSPLFLKIPGVSRIYYAPAGDLHLMNLQAFAWQSTKGHLNSCEFVRLNNTKEIVGLDSIRSQINSASLFGGIVYDYDSTLVAFRDQNVIENLEYSLPSLELRGDRSWPFLSFTSEEVANIHDIIEAVNITSHVYSGRAATEEDFYYQQQKSPDILHIATHGYFLEMKPVQSSQVKSNDISSVTDPLIRTGLLLANANYAWKTGEKYSPDLEDGILTAYEISLMDLSETKLVVLSACETALGDIDASEGVYGLQRAFKIAGVDKIIMSLWQVPDYHTKELMIQFYKNWLNEKMSIRTALTSAQKSLRDEGYEPFYWAGFVLLE